MGLDMFKSFIVDIKLHMLPTINTRSSTLLYVLDERLITMLIFDLYAIW